MPLLSQTTAGKSFMQKTRSQMSAKKGKGSSSRGQGGLSFALKKKKKHRVSSIAERGKKGKFNEDALFRARGTFPYAKKGGLAGLEQGSL